MFRSKTIIREFAISLAKFILILKHLVRLRRNLLCGSAAACPSMAYVLCAVLCTAHNTHNILLCTAHNTHTILLCTAHNTHAILGHAATPPHNKLRRNLTECFNINITLARFNCKLPIDGRIPKHVGAF